MYTIFAISMLIVVVFLAILVGNIPIVSLPNACHTIIKFYISLNTNYLTCTNNIRNACISAFLHFFFLCINHQPKHNTRNAMHQLREKLLIYVICLDINLGHFRNCALW